MKRRGFTVIEVLVVIAIIVILVSLLLPAIHHATSSASKINALPKVETSGGYSYRIDEISHKGHEYLICKFGGEFGITHNPDCPCTQPAEKESHSRY